MSFPRSVVFESCVYLGEVCYYHREFEDLVFRWGIVSLYDANGPGVRARFRGLFKFIDKNPDYRYDGQLISDLIVEKAVKRITAAFDSSALQRALERAGYTGEDGQVRRTLPEALDLPDTDDDVHTLLKRFGMDTPLGHLDQAIENHTRGNWAAANGQIRSFIESLLDEIAYRLVPDAPRGQKEGEARHAALATRVQPPFLSPELLEWSNDGKNLVNGIFKRLHPMGSHPGLSDEDDSTFRLHLVLLLGRLFLRRLAERA